MNVHAIAAAALLAAGCLLGTRVAAVPLTTQDIVELCTDADDPPHCGKLIERRQLRGHPKVAVRNGYTLEIPIQHGDPVRFTDNASRDYSLWQVFEKIDFAVVWDQAEDGSSSRFVMVDLVNGRTFNLAGEPVLSPDERHIASADFCAKGCTRELALWRVFPKELRKLRIYGATSGWIDVGVQWKDANTLLVDIDEDKGQGRTSRTLTLPLDDKAWKNP
jgi:hypothetical protein